MEWGKAVCGNMNMIVSDSSSYSCQFCSSYGVGYTSTIWFNQVRVARAGLVDPCPNNCFAFLNMVATIRVGPGFLVRNWSVSPGLEWWERGATSPKAGLWEHLAVRILSEWSSSNFLRPGAVSACLTLPYGMAGNVVELPVCFRDVASKILQPWRIVFIKVKPCSCIPDCYDMEIPRGLG